MIKPGDTILFQGDSITDAFRRPEEMNVSFQLGAGYAFLAASTILVQHPADNLTFLNRGVSGNSVSALRARWQNDCIDLRPDVLSILAGVNDTIQGLSLEETASSYRSLLEWTLSELPGVRLLLLEPFLLPCGEITPAQREDLRPRQDCVRALAEEFGASFIPLQQIFLEASSATPPDYFSYDGIHASPAGAALIARAWIDSAHNARCSVRRQDFGKSKV